MAILLLVLALLLLGGVRPAHAQSATCDGDYGGLLNGNVLPTPPNLLQIDGPCTIENYPASNPYGGSITWLSTNDTLLIFNNVDFVGNMSCDAHEHGDFIWFVNGSIARQHILKCANLFAPVDKIDKENPPGPPFVTIGVPFTYTLTFPQTYDALSGVVINPNGSSVEVDQVAVTDNLNASGVSLSYVSSSAAWKGSGASVPFSVTNAGGVLTFSGFPAIPAGQQIVLSVTVVLNNAVPPNSPGTQFTNTASWTLGTTIGGVFHYPLPGQNGTSSPPLTIAAPNLVMTKSGPATMNLGQLGQFTLNLQNTGNSNAWNATIIDKLPTGPNGGMCAATPQILSAQIVQANGRPVPGLPPLVAGTDYTLSYAGAPACTLTINLLSANAVIGPTEQLAVTYQTQLDANTHDGATLTNVAGATQWYNGPSSAPSRQSYTCLLTNGTPGVADCQDAHTVTAAISAVTITKQVTVVGGGPPVPGVTLDYLVNVTNASSKPVSPVTITDNLNAAGPGALTYVAGTATMNGSSNGVSVGGNVITGNYSATYGPLAPGGTVVLHFRATLGSALAAGTIVTNTGVVTWGNPPQSASGSVAVVVIAPTPPALTLTKGGPATLNIGQLGQFTLNVQNTGTTDAWNATIVDKLPTGATGGMCAATPQILSAQVFQSDGVTPVPGKGPLVGGTDYTLSYAAAPACTLTLNMMSAAAVVGASQRLIIVYQTQLDANTHDGATLTNVAGATQWYSGPSSNPGRLSYTCLLTNGTPGVLDCQDAHTVIAALSVVTIIKQVAVVGGGTAVPGSTVQYLVHVTNNSAHPVTPVVITDDLNAAGAGALTYVAGSATMNGSATGVTVNGNVITANYSATYGALAPGGTIDLQFRATLGQTVATGTFVTNTGVVTWNTPPQSASGSVSIQVNTPPGALTVTKTTPLVQVTRGQLVPYTIVVTNVLTGPVQGASLVDSFPAGFRYVPGSARLDDVPTEPTSSGFQLAWSNLNFAAGAHHTIVLLLAVGAGVGEGEFVNHAQAFEAVAAAAVARAQGPAALPRAVAKPAQAPALILGTPLSADATAKVVVVPDTTFDCTDVIGKVFDDANGNGRQDKGEQGIPGVRILTTEGLAAITDEFGRFHITCAITPLEGRGSNFALKLDDRTLPSGYRMTTPQVLVERATRGKALRFNFGASIHRVVSLDLSDAAFEPGTADVRLQWRPRLDLLLAELRKSRSVLRLSYLADVEDKPLVDRRVQTLAQSISDDWRAMNGGYELTIEREVFWLRGSPPREPRERLRGAQ